jgi:hypothetical protein
MVKYSKPVWQMVMEAAEELDEFTAKDVKIFIKKHYPDDNVNELTIGAQVIACSLNHPSARHYPDSQRFLRYFGNGRYRLADPDERQGLNAIPKKFEKGIKYGSSDKGYFTQIRNGQIRIPRNILQKMSLKENDFVAFVESTNGDILLKKAELRVIG